ncbi:2-keto-4-pentenoate hydratase [Noviherbaspirillum sp.]|uniref:2-keto-4-pentenoate hydratase n=1 Tax=Noviherbaspirillum sp. TaxID=1926288 RepID=UPI002FE2A166
MPASFELDTLAREMKAAQDDVRQIAPLTSRHPDFDLVSAYALADRMHQARVRGGAKPVGRKIGFTNPDMWSVYGVHEPIWAHVYDTTVVHVGDKHAACRIGRFAEPKIEPEIVFHFHSAPPPDGDLDALLACIDWVAHGFEIVQSHFPGWKFKAADTVADGALHGTLLVGEPQPVDALGPDVMHALKQFSLTLFCNVDVSETGVGANVLGGPLAAIAHLNAVLAKQPQFPPLQANELVTTGTITAARAIKPGEVWRTEIDGIALRGLSVEFTS